MMNSILTGSRKWSALLQKMEQLHEPAHLSMANAPEYGAVAPILESLRLQKMETLLSYQGVGLDDDEKGVSSIHTPGGQQSMSVINEPGLFALVLGSQKCSTPSLHQPARPAIVFV